MSRHNLYFIPDAEDQITLACLNFVTRGSVLTGHDIHWDEAHNIDVEKTRHSLQSGMDIAEKQVVAKQTEQDINVTSEKYRPVAHRAALLFFLLNDLFKVHTYYIYSLSAFVTIFIRGIDLVSGRNDPMNPVDRLSHRLSATPVSSHFHAEGSAGMVRPCAPMPCSSWGRPAA